MSLKHNKNVPELVKNYRSKYPNVDRDLLRKLIRLENKIENPSELKKLDRCLRKSFLGLKIAEAEKPSTEVKPQIRTDVNTGALYAAIVYYRTLGEFFSCKAGTMAADILEKTARNFGYIPRES